jgi:O-antigen/teichoic acid export membrane protein
MDINKLTRNYIVQSIALALVVKFLCDFVAKVYDFNLFAATIVSFMFVLVVDIASVFVWRWVTLKHSDMLPTFFTALSGARLLLALAVMFVWYLTDANDSMLHFFLVFMAFYVVSLVHHSIFFARVSNRS